MQGNLEQTESKTANHSVTTQTENINTANGTCTDKSKISGRRIVELELLGRLLDKGCLMCNTHLQLSNIVSERTYGLASMLYIRCSKCDFINTVQTGKRHYDPHKAKTMPVFDVNTKAAGGKY